MAWLLDIAALVLGALIDAVNSRANSGKSDAAARAYQKKLAQELYAEQVRNSRPLH